MDAGGEAEGCAGCSRAGAGVYRNRYVLLSRTTCEADPLVQIAAPSPNDAQLSPNGVPTLSRRAICSPTCPPPLPPPQVALSQVHSPLSRPRTRSSCVNTRSYSSAPRKRSSSSLASSSPYSPSPPLPLPYHRPSLPPPPRPPRPLPSPQPTPSPLSPSPPSQLFPFSPHQSSQPPSPTSSTLPASSPSTSPSPSPSPLSPPSSAPVDQACAQAPAGGTERFRSSLLARRGARRRISVAESRAGGGSSRAR